MALNNLIRRVSSSKVVPLAIRMGSGGTQRYHHHCCAVLSAAVKSSSSVCGGNFVKPSEPSAVQRYSTNAVDQSLFQLLDEVCAEGQEPVQATEIPEGFPFMIEDIPGLNTITLTREYQGETIEVEVDMPLIVAGEGDDGDVDQGEEGDDGDIDQDEEGDEGYVDQLPLVVRITREGRPSLEFECTAYLDEITIDCITVKDPETTEDERSYEGPDFADLDENLQKAFLKYLEVRGIKPSTTDFLHEYMVNKDAREYLLWVKKIKHCIQV